MLKGNKVVPQTGVFHAKIHEINVSCSLSTTCASISGITGKIKLFPEAFISAICGDLLLQAVCIIVHTASFSEQCAR
jgi:hypothetical protein